ncbi:armadillo-type protein [Mycena belliarum]|uniref:Armadillo-type protein n=1 Tax=Mycena belliarum TaxID=1033014 RepID=A0AAD6TXK4_9AGAR|nr:armadillo-type protein [Mycena belliae]
MDVPFVSSGALSRAHYALVKNVESAPSPSIADSYIFKEVESIRSRLRHPHISIKETKECLIILLYCSMSISSHALPTPSFDFALPQAVNLAEAGKKIHEKQIGYLFCAELMSPTHELRLMLVNTLRKDLESSSTSLICLALDNLITSPSEDVVPAVQSRVYDLLSSQSSHVRRRAMLACSALSHHEPDLLRRIGATVLKRLADPHPVVVGAALTAALLIFKIHEPARPDIREAVNNLLQQLWPNKHEQSVRCILLQVLQILRTVGLHPPSLELLLQIIRTTSQSLDHPVMFAAFLLLSDTDIQDLRSAIKSESLSPVANIRHLLTSRSVNDQHIFLSCLSCLNPEVWAGTNADIPAVLDEWEVGRVMELLDSSDIGIRRKTLGILNSADANIVNSYYSQSLQTLPNDLNLSGLSEYTTRLLEVAEIQSDGDGELYARQLVDLFARMEARSPRYAQFVVENAVEMVLLHMRNAATSFQIGCATTLVTSLTNPETFLGQTMMVIMPALATEYSGKLAVPPPDVLRGLSSRLHLCSLAVQDACLLAMLRISAECEQVPSEVLIRIRDLGDQSRRHIRKRCEEFTSLAAQKAVLAMIIQSSQSSSLPDFVDALRNYQLSASKSKPTHDRLRDASSPSSSHASLPGNKLRYTAYEAPQPTPRLRNRASSGGSSHSGSRASSQLSGNMTGKAMEELSRTVTAGDLALAAAAEEFELSSRASEKHTPASLVDAGEHHRVISAEGLAQNPAPDLIAFNDSPFISDPYADNPNVVEPMWNSFKESSGARGWCDASVEEVIKRLDSMEDTLEIIPVEETPFIGELKVLVNGGDAARGVGVLRLRVSEDGSCLWRMRGDAGLQIRVKRLLSGLE